NSVMAADCDCCPMLFNVQGCLTFISKLEMDIPKQSIQRNLSATECFRNMDKKAMTEDQNNGLGDPEPE
ncbi:Actin- protein 2/3 complex subunit 1A, partial [Saguinus oedipus]